MVTASMRIASSPTMVHERIKSLSLKDHPLFKKAQEAHRQLDKSLFTFHVGEGTSKEALTVFDALQHLELTERELKKMDPFADEVKEEILTLQAARDGAQELVNLKPKLTSVRKWIDAGYDRKAIETDPQAVDFIVESGLIYMIKMYKDQGGVLKNNDVDVKIQEGKVSIKVQGQWKACSEVQKEIVFDPIQKKFVGWTFVHPKGFCPTDSLDWKTLAPCAELSSEALASLHRTADRFWKNHAEVDPGKKKTCVLQVVAVEGSKFLPNMPLLKNTEDLLPRHVHIRLVDEEGRVYSFSTKMTKENEEFVLGKFRFAADTGISLRTADTKITSPDYEESRKFLHSDMASIPITVDRFKTIKDTVERMNQKGGIRFCFTKQNCCRFSQEIMKLAGVDVDTKMSGPTFFYRLTPDLEAVPLIGKPLSALAQTVSSVWTKICDFFSFVTPKPLQHLFVWVKAAVTYIPRKLCILSINIFYYVIGAKESRPSQIEGDLEKHTNNTLRLVHFQQLIHSVRDFFDEETSSMYHSRLMIDWMKRQGSYQSFDNKPSGLVIV